MSLTRAPLTPQRRCLPISRGSSSHPRHLRHLIRHQATEAQGLRTGWSAADEHRGSVNGRVCRCGRIPSASHAMLRQRANGSWSQAGDRLNYAANAYGSCPRCQQRPRCQLCFGGIRTERLLKVLSIKSRDLRPTERVDNLIYAVHLVRQRLQSADSQVSASASNPAPIYLQLSSPVVVPPPSLLLYVWSY